MTVLRLCISVTWTLFLCFNTPGFFVCSCLLCLLSPLPGNVVTIIHLADSNPSIKIHFQTTWGLNTLRTVSHFHLCDDTKLWAYLSCYRTCCLIYLLKIFWPCHWILVPRPLHPPLSSCPVPTPSRCGSAHVFWSESWWMGWSQSGEWWVNNICNHWTSREVPGHSVLLHNGAVLIHLCPLQDYELLKTRNSHFQPCFLSLNRGSVYSGLSRKVYWRKQLTRNSMRSGTMLFFFRAVCTSSF